MSTDDGRVSVELLNIERATSDRLREDNAKLRAALAAAQAGGAPSEDDVARVLNNSRGFGYTDTPEDGQDLYDISQDALRDARAVLALLRDERGFK